MSFLLRRNTFLPVSARAPQPPPANHLLLVSSVHCPPVSVALHLHLHLHLRPSHPSLRFCTHFAPPPPGEQHPITSRLASPRLPQAAAAIGVTCIRLHAPRQAVIWDSSPFLRAHSLAERLNPLAGFWSIGKNPSSTSSPSPIHRRAPSIRVAPHRIASHLCASIVPSRPQRGGLTSEDLTKHHVDVSGPSRHGGRPPCQLWRRPSERAPRSDPRRVRVES